VAPDSSGDPAAGPDGDRDPLVLLTSVLAGEPGAHERVEFVRDLAVGDPVDPALEVLATWFRRAHQA
jgi:hypothetical protein